MPATLDELSQVSGARLEGKSDCSIESVNTLKNAKKGEITFLSNRRYVKDLLSTKASAVILSEEDLEKCPSYALVSETPYLAYAMIVMILMSLGVALTQLKVFSFKNALISSVLSSTCLASDLLSCFKSAIPLSLLSI